MKAFTELRARVDSVADERLEIVTAARDVTKFTRRDSWPKTWTFVC